MIKIGITGGIGSGKSLVSKAFALLNVPTYNADKRAKTIIHENKNVKDKITKLLGEEAYLPSGVYNSALVAKRVFSNEELLNQLNGIVHPEVKADANSWFQTNELAPYIIYEAAIMNAAGDGNFLDYVIVVEANDETRLRRILRRDSHRGKNQIKEIMAKQKSAEEFQKISDFTIKNNESDLVLEQVLALHERFLTL